MVWVRRGPWHLGPGQFGVDTVYELVEDDDFGAAALSKPRSVVVVGITNAPEQLPIHPDITTCRCPVDVDDLLRQVQARDHHGILNLTHAGLFSVTILH